MSGNHTSASNRPKEGRDEPRRTEARWAFALGPKMSSHQVWRFHMPETSGIQKSDTVKFLPKHPLPTTTVGPVIVESLDKIEDVLTRGAPPHTVMPSEGGANDAIH